MKVFSDTFGQFDHLMHPCWISLISFKKKKKAPLAPFDKGDYYGIKKQTVKFVTVNLKTIYHECNATNLAPIAIMHNIYYLNYNKDCTISQLIIKKKQVTHWMN